MFRFTNFILIELTLDCNLRCAYCYLREKHSYAGKLIPLDTYKKVIDKIIEQKKLNVKNNNRVTQIILHGGEPTLVGEDFMEEILEYTTAVSKFNEVPIKLVIQTNGLLISQRYVDMFRKYNVTVGISLDGILEGNSLRINNEDAQKKIEDNIKLFLDNDYPVGVLSVVTTNNIDKLKEISEHYFDLSQKRIRTKMFSVDDVNELDIEASGKEFFEKVWLPSLTSILTSDGTDGYKFARIERLLERAVIDIFTYHNNSCQSTCSFPFCGSGVTIVAVQPDGEVNSCDRWDTSCYDQARVMHFQDYDFLGVTQLRRALKFNKMKHEIVIENDCDTCYANYICEHQCQSLFYSKHKKYGLDKSRICEKYKLLYTYIIEHMSEIIDYYIKYQHAEIPSTEDRIIALKYLSFTRSKKFDLILRKNGHVSKEGKQSDMLRIELRNTQNTDKDTSI